MVFLMGSIKMEINIHNNPSGEKLSQHKRHEWENSRSIVLENIKSYYNDIAEVKIYGHWLDFARIFKEGNLDKNCFFRGHSNCMKNAETFNFWQIQSNLNRSYPDVSLEDFLENISHGSQYFSFYGIEKENDGSPGLIEIMAYLQHYGVPTPLVDFSTDPITAFYFSCSNFPTGDIHYPQAYYLSVFEIDTKIFEEDYGVKRFTLSNDIQIYNSIEKIYPFKVLDYPEKIKDSKSSYIAICPMEDQPIIKNSKLNKQDGAFIMVHFPRRIFYKNKLTDILSLEEVLKIIKIENGLRSKPIVLHLIPYLSIIDESEDVFFSYDLLFTYFKEKGKTGYHLFSDLMGFKYDFMFSSERKCSMVDPFSSNYKRAKDILLAKGVI